MKVEVYSFITCDNETIFVTSECGKHGVDIDVFENDMFHCHPVGCHTSLDRIFFNRKEAIDFAENWCSIV